MLVASGAAFGLLAAGLLGSPSHAADDTVEGLRAARAARAGDCAEALDLLAGLTSPGAELRLVQGRCEIKLRRFPEAVETLRGVLATDPGLPGAQLALAVALFHTGDLDGARAALARSNPPEADAAEAELYRGLLLLADADSGPAAAALERARLLDPRMDLTASYYAGLAWAGASERARAEQALRRVVEMAPGSDWAVEAQRALDELEGERNWWLWAKGGLEYDDNVLLRSQGTPVAFSGSHDIRGAFEVHGGAELLRKDDWSVGAALDYYGLVHADLDEFDQHVPLVGVWVDRRLAERTTARLRYDLGYSWVGGDPFQFAQAWTLTLFQDFGDRGRSRVYARPYLDDYLFSKDQDVPDGPGMAFAPCLSLRDLVCAPPGIDEREQRNRDGWGLMLGAEHDLPVPALRTEFTAGYRFDRFDAEGGEFSYFGHDLLIESRTRLPWDLHLRIQGRFVYRPYDQGSSFPDPSLVFLNREYPLEDRRRRDHVIAALIELEKRWTPRVSTSIQYRWVDQDSSVKVFRYDREILGVYVTVRL